MDQPSRAQRKPPKIGIHLMKTVLFITAPFGPAMKAIGSALEARGAKVLRVVENGGEVLSTPRRNRIRFCSRRQPFGVFLRNTIRRHNVDTVVTFNDTQDRNREALAIARDMDREIRILENGYLRPHWITVDCRGVNGNACYPRCPDFYLKQAHEPQPVELFRNCIRSHVHHTIAHHVSCYLMAWRHRFDPRSYGDHVLYQGQGYVREYLWRQTHSEATTSEAIAEHRANGRPMFLAVLQKPGDAQLKHHSDFGANAPYMREVMRSFAADAPADAILLVKQHPLDYGRERLPAVFESMQRELGLEGRAYYLRSTKIDSWLDEVAGVITINSTMGLKALQLGCPVLALGTAIYAMPRLTHQGALEDFWHAPQRPDADVCEGFLRYLQATCQVNGGFYSKSARAVLARNIADAILEPHVLPRRVMPSSAPLNDRLLGRHALAGNARRPAA